MIFNYLAPATANNSGNEIIIFIKKHTYTKLLRILTSTACVMTQAKFLIHSLPSVQRKFLQGSIPNPLFKSIIYFAFSFHTP